MDDILHSPRYYQYGGYEQFQDLFQENGRIVHYKKGELIVGANDFMDKNYYILDGIMRFYVVGEDFDTMLEKTIYYIGHDDMFPLYSPIEKKCRFELENQYLEARTDVTAICITQKTLKKLMLEHPDLAIQVLNKYAELAGILLYDSINLSRSAVRRVCNFLAMYERTLKPANVILTQDEIAFVTGTTLPSVARVLKRLRQDGIIETNRKSIKIIDSERLEELCSDAGTPDDFI